MAWISFVAILPTKDAFKTMRESMFWPKVWQDEKTWISSQFTIMVMWMKIGLKWQAPGQVIIDAHCFSSPVFLGLCVSWFPLGTLYQNVALQPCHKLVESVLPIWIPSVRSYSPTQPALLPAFSFFPLQSARCSLYRPGGIFATGGFAIWMAICNPINPTLIVLWHCFLHVIMLFNGSWCLSFDSGTQISLPPSLPHLCVCACARAYRHMGRHAHACACACAYGSQRKTPFSALFSWEPLKQSFSLNRELTVLLSRMVDSKPQWSCLLLTLSTGAAGAHTDTWHFT